MDQPGSVLTHEMAIGPDSAREYLRITLNQLGVDLSDASRVVGRNHAYIQQYLAGRSPRWLPEDVREGLVRAYPSIEGERLKKPGVRRRFAIDGEELPSLRQSIATDGAEQGKADPPFQHEFVDEPSLLKLIGLYRNIHPSQRELLLQFMELLAARSLPPNI